MEIFKIHDLAKQKFNVVSFATGLELLEFQILTKEV
jgi:hypothetical protein